MNSNDNIDFLLDDTNELEQAIKRQLDSRPQASAEDNSDKTEESKKNPDRQSNKNVGLDDYTTDKKELEDFLDKKMRGVNISADDVEDEEEDEDEDEEDKGKEGDAEENASSENDDDNSSEDEDDFLAILREEELLDIPEDFADELTPEKLIEFKAQTRERQKREARDEIISEMRSRFASNAKNLEALDYFLTGESSANLSYFQEVQDYIEAFEGYDLRNEDIQRDILTDWLQDGLDPSNPAHKMRLDRVDQEVDEIINNLEGEKRAKEAKQFFLQKFETLKQQEITRANAAKIARDAQETANREKEEQWHQTFQKHINNNTWNPTKKQSVLTEQYGQVMLNDGRKVPVWYAKEMMIRSNPELYAVYLDWLSTNFDMTQGKFNSTQTTSKEIVNRKLIQAANKKGGSRHNSSQVDQANKNVQRRVLSREDLLGG